MLLAGFVGSQRAPDIVERDLNPKLKQHTPIIEQDSAARVARGLTSSNSEERLDAERELQTLPAAEREQALQAIVRGYRRLRRMLMLLGLTGITLSFLALMACGRIPDVATLLLETAALLTFVPICRLVVGPIKHHANALAIALVAVDNVAEMGTFVDVLLRSRRASPAMCDAIEHSLEMLKDGHSCVISAAQTRQIVERISTYWNRVNWRIHPIPPARQAIYIRELQAMIRLLGAAGTAGDLRRIEGFVKSSNITDAQRILQPDINEVLATWRDRLEDRVNPAHLLRPSGQPSDSPTLLRPSAAQAHDQAVESLRAVDRNPADTDCDLGAEKTAEEVGDLEARI